MSGAELHRIESLLEFARALTGFRDRTSGISVAMARRTARAEEALTARRQQLQREIEELEDALRDEDTDDEGDDGRAQLEAAARELEEVEKLTGNLSAARDEYDRALTGWRRARDLSMQAAEFVKTKNNQAADYLRQPLSPDDFAAGGDIIGATYTPSEGRQEGVTPANAQSVFDLPPLPQGFTWCPITNLDPGPTSLLKQAGKVPLETMRFGLNLLWDELLPLIASNPAHGRSACEDFDQAQGRIDPSGLAHPKSLAELWSAFFGRDHIRVEVRRDGGREIIDGQHRILAARELGWRYIPARVIRKEEGRGDGLST